MLRPREESKNRANLILMLNMLRGLEHFVFFGTLLGLHRDGELIPYDDDVDLYINSKHRESLLRILTQNGHCPTYNTEHFIQVVIEIDGLEHFVDFYLYDIDEKNGILIERWNFHAQPEVARYALHIPLDMIFPLFLREYHGSLVPMPAKAGDCCAFLYGESWQIPRLKNFGYEIEIYENKPKISLKENGLGVLLTSYFEEIEKGKTLEEAKRQAEERLFAAEKRIQKVEGEVAKLREYVDQLTCVVYDLSDRFRSRSRDYAWLVASRSLLKGLHEAKSKSSLPPIVSLEAFEVVHHSAFFDHKFYLAVNPDVGASGMDPVLHFLLYGGMEGRDPGPNFSTKLYLERNPDVATAGVNALLHFELYGRNECRSLFM